MDSNQSQKINESPAKYAAPVDIDDDWQDADLVQSFSPVATTRTESDHVSPATSRPSQPPTLSIATSSALLDSRDWEAWETPRGPSPQPAPSDTTLPTSADDAFFEAFEKAAVVQPAGRPSPPIIDLRQMERKLDQDKRAKQGLQVSDLDFFDSFEERPGEAMSDAKRRVDDKARLNASQLKSMQEAQASPMNIHTPRGKTSSKADYFGDNEDLMMNSPSGVEGGKGVERERMSSPPRTNTPPRTDSWSDTAGSWAGTFRKTLGTIRGQAADFAQHLPSSKDFIVPEGELEEEEEEEGEEEGKEEEEEEEEEEKKRRDVTEGHEDGPASEENIKVTSPARRIARVSDHSQSSPFGVSGGSGPIASPPLQALARGKSLGSSSLPRPINGAPGFNVDTTRYWNTGSWSLSSSEEAKRNKRAIPVHLKGRREETQDVVTEDLASHLTAHLPKRLQLGKTWKLLYSSDQHGISLGTLYWKVQSGLDSSNTGGRKSDNGVADAEGWLRGASQQTKEAVTGIRRVGGGINLTDAGLVLAIKDSNDNIFGAFVNERIRAQSSYYGSGECFLWKAVGDSEVKTYKWTGCNDYMVLTEAHYLSFGGGDGKYGLWLDGQLEKGVSSKCPAFDNEVLCETDPGSKQQGDFECITLEVWACGID
ncbi:hypothetical protein CBS101457_006459 [Exobasidium rhododendri]|nr:hypothetical protein CBS101457_006459 [Exobasidium rhododendri]